MKELDAYLEANKEKVLADLELERNYKTVAEKWGITWQKLQAFSKSTWGYQANWRQKFARKVDDIVIPKTNKKTKRNFDVEEFIDSYSKVYEMKRERTWEQDNVIIEFPPIHTLFVGMGCIHLGGDGSDLVRMRDDLEQINVLPSTYLWILGDILANTRNIARSHRGFTDEEALDVQRELADWLFDKFGHKIMALVVGNHDEWSYKSDGMSWGDVWAQKIAGGYLGQEGIATVKYVDPDTGRLVNVYRNWIAHTTKGHSMYNPTHGGNRVLMNRDANLDVVWWSHIHNTGVQQMHRHDQQVVTYIRSGGYQLDARYVKGWAVQQGTLAIPGVIYHPYNHSVTPFFDFHAAIDIIESLNSNYSKKEQREVKVTRKDAESD